MDRLRTECWAVWLVMCLCIGIVVQYELKCIWMMMPSDWTTSVNTNLRTELILISKVITTGQFHSLQNHVKLIKSSVSIYCQRSSSNAKPYTVTDWLLPKLPSALGCLTVQLKYGWGLTGAERGCVLYLSLHQVFTSTDREQNLNHKRSHKKIIINSYWIIAIRFLIFNGWPRALYYFRLLFLKMNIIDDK